MKAEKETEKAPVINSKNTNSNLIWGTKRVPGACQVRKQRGKNQQINTSKKTFNSQQYYKGVDFFFCIFLPQVLDFCLLSSLVPFPLYLQQFGTRTCHFAWYLLHFGMVTLHFAWYLLHLAMFACHFAWYLSDFGISTSCLHGICYILVLQRFMWVS